NPSAYVTNLVFDPLQRLFVSSTEPHYDILTLSTDKTIGREVLRLTPFPAITPVTINYNYGGSNLLTEAQNWILTASNAYAATLALRAVTAEIYRISSASNNAAPATYGSPIDTLRQFLCTCAIESNYAAVFTLSGSVRTNACAGVSNLLALALPRPTTNIAL